MYINAAAIEARVVYFGSRDTRKCGYKEYDRVEDRISQDQAPNYPGGGLFLLVIVENVFDLPENGILGAKHRWTIDNFDQVLHLYSVVKVQIMRFKYSISYGCYPIV